MTRWPCPGPELPTLEVLPAEYGKVQGELHFTAHRAKLNGAPLHLDIHEVCMDLYDPLFTACPSVVFQGLCFLLCPTFIPPMMLHTLDLMLQGQPHSSTAPFPKLLCGCCTHP